MELLTQALISAMVSAAVSGIGVYYLQRYLEERRKKSEEEAKRRRIERRKSDVLEARRRRATGRLFFWLHDAVVKGVEHANGDLQRAFDDYNDVEAEQKAFEQELLAAHQDENRSV